MFQRVDQQRRVVEYVIGLCLGRPHEHSGLVVLEVAWYEEDVDRDTRAYSVIDLRRYEAGTNYDVIATDVAKLARTQPLYRREEKYRPNDRFQGSVVRYYVEH